MHQNIHDPAPLPPLTDAVLRTLAPALGALEIEHITLRDIEMVNHHGPALIAEVIALRAAVRAEPAPSQGAPS